MQFLQEQTMKTGIAIQHPSRDALARYLTRSISSGEREQVEWHLEYCPICEKEITVRHIVDIAKGQANPFSGGGSFR